MTDERYTQLVDQVRCGSRTMAQAIRQAAIESALEAKKAAREECANICDHEHGTAGDAADKIRAL